MIPKALPEITEADLQEFIDNQILESKTIEYKGFFPHSEPQTEEFLKSICSFVNASGGDLILGIKEDRTTGAPTQLQGFTKANTDQEMLKLSNKIRNGIEPNIVPFPKIQPVPCGIDKEIFVIRMQGSLTKPHRVNYNKHYQFYSRAANGKFPMDIPAIRTAFTLSETQLERIRQFRMNRIGLILTDETPVPLKENGKIVLHLIPITAFDPTKQYDIITALEDSNSPIQKINPPYRYGLERYNIDGIVKFGSEPATKCRSYVQLFRNGIIEYVDAHSIRIPPYPPHQGKLFIFSNYEKELVRFLSQCLPFFLKFQVDLPIYVFLTLLGVKGCIMYHDEREFMFNDPKPFIEREHLFTIPEQIIDDYDFLGEVVLKPAFDAVWNACGRKQSENYSDIGIWKPL